MFMLIVGIDNLLTLFIKRVNWKLHLRIDHLLSARQRHGKGEGERDAAGVKACFTIL